LSKKCEQGIKEEYIFSLTFEQYNTEQNLQNAADNELT